jgi:hypothetical protein
MGRYVSWVHGNALTVESPEKIVPGGRHFGWGADLVIRSGEAGWFHIPLPVPAVVADATVYFDAAILLFMTEANAALKQVHLYDGASILQEFDGGSVYGDFRPHIVPANTFRLTRSRAVQRGIGLSFFVQGTLGPSPNRLVVAAAGAEYSVTMPRYTAAQPILGAVTGLFGRLLRQR